MRRTPSKPGVVGMTEGAKNRRSRRTSNYFRCACGWVGQPDDMAESPDGHTACPECGARWTGMQVVHPPELRAGQRVRPCRGCAACNPRYSMTIRAYIMQPWGWPVGVADSFKHVNIPDGTPCIPLCYYNDASSRSGIVKVKLGRKRIRIEEQYVCTDRTRLCDGSGLLPAKKSRPRRRLGASHVLAVLDRSEPERADAERLVATCGDDLALVRAIAWIAACDGRIADTERRLASGWTIPERRDGFSDEDLLATYLDHTPPRRTAL